MKVSIITSAYNCESHIMAMINSIIYQTHCDWEMILIDDASDDNTWKIISEVKDDRLIKIRNQKNVGLTKNLNKALSIATGDYILRMDADDIASINRMEKQVAFMEENPDVVLSGGWMQCFGEIHDITKTHLNDEDIRIDMLFNSAIMHPTFVIRGEVLKKYNIKYNENLKYAQDYDFAYTASQFGKLANIPEILVRYRTHDKQIGSACGDKQRKCADVTRKKILKDLKIDLNGNEFGIWSDFCLGKTNLWAERERNLLADIVEQILLSNRWRQRYNDKKLRWILSEKMRVLTVQMEPNTKSQLFESEKYKRLFGMMVRWTKLKQNGANLAGWFMARNYQHIAIYGMGDVGECLIDELKNSSIEVIYGVDVNVGIRCPLSKLISPDDKFEQVDAIIVTAIFFITEIRQMLTEKVTFPIISLEDIIYDMELQ